MHDWGRTWLRCSVWDWSHMHFRCRMDHRRGRRADRRVHFRHRARLDPRCRLRNRRTYGRLRASLLRRCSRSRHLRPCRRLSARPQSGSSRRARPNGGLIPWASDFRAARRGNLRPGGRLGRPMRDGRRTPSGRSWPAKGRQRMLIHRRSSQAARPDLEQPQAGPLPPPQPVSRPAAPASVDARSESRRAGWQDPVPPPEPAPHNPPEAPPRAPGGRQPA